MRDLTTWTVLQNDGPDHLGLRCNALPWHQMALKFTSGCACPSELIEMVVQMMKADFEAVENYR